MHFLGKGGPLAQGEAKPVAAASSVDGAYSGSYLGRPPSNFSPIGDMKPLIDSYKNAVAKCTEPTSFSLNWW